jgi:HK97 family phage portal protein
MWAQGKINASEISTDPMVASAYENCAVAYACIRRLSMDAAGVPLVFLRDPDDFESVVAPGDKVRSLFLMPNSAMTTRRLIAFTVLMRVYRGECFWTFSESLAEVYPWHDPRGWKEKVSGQDGLYAWEFRQGNVGFQKAAREVFWTGEENPSNPFRGISPLQAAAQALAIDRYGDRLQASMVGKGGERGLVLSTDVGLQPDQAEMLLRELARRRPGEGSATHDVVLPYGLTLQNPDFTKEDLDILAMQNASKDKICHVYGMAPVLIGDDDAAQYKSAPEAIKLYWQQTMVPMLRSLEDSWDKFFVYDRGLGTYVRFDLSQTPAMQEDQQEIAQTFAVYVNAGVPMAAVNSKLGTGFADEDMVIGEALDDDPEPAPEPEQRSITKGLTNEIIRKRALDYRFKAQRQRRLDRIERSTWNRLKELNANLQRDVSDLVRAAVNERGMSAAAAAQAVSGVRDLRARIGDGIVEAVEPGQVEAAQIGVASVQEIVDGKMLAWHDRVKAISFTPEVQAILRERRGWLVRETGANWSASIAEAVTGLIDAAVEQNESVGWVVSRLRDVFSTLTRKSAATIARTETGTAYNSARYSEMANQDFKKHEWVTSLDEMTRDGENSEFDHASADGEVVRIGDRFSTNLHHPQENGGSAGNVINCRCETIPVVED